MNNKNSTDLPKPGETFHHSQLSPSPGCMDHLCRSLMLGPMAVMAVPGSNWLVVEPTPLNGKIKNMFQTTNQSIMVY